MGPATATRPDTDAEPALRRARHPRHPRPGAVLRGWRLTALLGLLLVAMSVAVVALEGTGREGVAAWVRATARTSALLFLVVYLARPLQSVRPSAPTRFALRERRSLGVAVAISHVLHLAGIAWLARGWPSAFETSAATVAVGGLATFLLLAMAATSSDAAQRRLGRRRWKRLHQAGLHLLWLVFLVTFAGRVGPGPAYAAPVLLLGMGALLRAALFLRRRRPAAAPAG